MVPAVVGFTVRSADATRLLAALNPVGLVEPLANKIRRLDVTRQVVPLRRRLVSVSHDNLALFVFTHLSGTYSGQAHSFGAASVGVVEQVIPG